MSKIWPHPATSQEQVAHIKNAHGEFSPSKWAMTQRRGITLKERIMKFHDWLHDNQTPLNMHIPHGRLDHE